MALQKSLQALPRAAETSLASMVTHEIQLEAQKFQAAVKLPAEVFAEHDILRNQMYVLARVMVYGMRKQHYVPKTWWDHLKKTLCQRWPRLTTWVQYTEVQIDVMALFPELKVVRERQAIWYTAQPAIYMGDDTDD